MFINPKLTIVISVVNPKMTPNMSGIVFFIPWLNPEWEATILFGPGEQLVTNINKHKDKISGCINTKLLEVHFLNFVKDVLV